MKHLTKWIRDRVHPLSGYRLPVLVNFLVCGTQKGGTSALYEYLRLHPEICVPGIKEAHFFNNEKYFEDGEPDYSGYHGIFDPGPEHRCVGEVTPIYMYWDSAPRRIWEYNPGMKIVVILRNPIERAYSHWNMERLRGMDAVSFSDAIRTEEERCREALPHQHMFYSYIDRGFYAAQLRRLWRFFPRNHVLVLRAEDLRVRPQETLESVFGFLGVTACQVPSVGEVNSHPYAAGMPPSDLEYLKAVYENEIRELERLLGWDCSGWLAE